MEPIAMREHPALAWHPEYHGMQAILFCNEHFNYGLSVVWARPENPGEYTGLYCGPDTYEVALIQFDYEGEIDPWRHTLLPEGSEEPIGWLTIEQIDLLCQRIREFGIEGYKEFDRQEAIR